MRLTSKDIGGSSVVTLLIGTVIAFVIAAALYPLVGGQVENLTNESHEDYVGDDTAGLVSMAPLFYWLAVILSIISVAIVVLKTTD